ncbi:hypothetical protein ACOSP7_026656 [Xanthoceras sorbifolium]
MTGMIKEGASSTRPPLSDGSNYAFWKARIRAYLKANDERLSRFPNKTHGHHTLEFSEERDDGKEMAIVLRRFKKFLKGKRIGGGFKSANTKKDFVPRKFENDKGKSKGVQYYEFQGYGYIASE